jgi:hypothetical protein
MTRLDKNLTQTHLRQKLTPYSQKQSYALAQSLAAAASGIRGADTAVGDVAADVPGLHEHNGVKSSPHIHEVWGYPALLWGPPDPDPGWGADAPQTSRTCGGSGGRQPSNRGLRGGSPSVCTCARFQVLTQESTNTTGSRALLQGVPCKIKACIPGRGDRFRSWTPGVSPGRSLVLHGRLHGC